MQTVWKFVLTLVDRPVVEMPAGAQVLSVAVQGDQVCLWARVDPDEPKELRHFRCLGTGHAFSEADQDTLGRFVGTVLLMDGGLVFHLFELDI